MRGPGKTRGDADAQEMDRLLAVDEPVIVWRLDPIRKIQVAVAVHDPHKDSGHNGSKTHCRHGHEFTPDNIITTPTGRQCRACKNASTSAWQKRKRARDFAAELTAARTEL